MAEQQNERKGFVFFYDTLDSLADSTDAEFAMFVRAMGEYSRFGVLPDFNDRFLKATWRQAKNGLDETAKTWEKNRKSRQYSSYVSSMKRRYQKEHPGQEAVEGRDYLCRDEWDEQQDDEASGSERMRTEASGSNIEKELENKNKSIFENKREEDSKGETAAHSFPQRFEPLSADEEAKRRRAWDETLEKYGVMP